MFNRFWCLERSVIDRKKGLAFGQQLQFFCSNHEDIPIIRIPKYMENNLGNTIYHEHRKVKETNKKRRQKAANPLNPEHFNKKIISWTGDKKFFHYYGRRYDPNNVPLISKFFLKETSNGKKNLSNLSIDLNFDII